MKFRVRRADIDPELRKTFEQYGVSVMQQLLVNQDHIFLHKNQQVTARGFSFVLLAWLTEQYDRAQRKETFNLLMEIAILVFVGLEVIFAAADFISKHL
jgi:hypothetical protein